MYKFITIVFILAFFCSIASAGYLDGVTQTDVDTYDVIMKKLEFSSDGGSTWHTAFEGSETFSILDVNQDEKVGQLIAGASLPAGTYTMARLTVDATFLIKGSVSYQSQTYYTTAGTEQNSNTTGPAGESTVVNPDGDFVQTVNGSLTVTAGTTVTVDISINTDDVLGMTQTGQSSYLIIPKPPDWTFTQV